MADTAPRPDLSKHAERQIQQLEELQKQRAQQGGAIYHVNHWFRKVATQVAHAMGSPWAFVTASLVVVAWAISGPMFGYSQTWQLIINTGTTIVTFLMIFLVQNTQNRDSRAIHLKLDELLRGVKGARTEMVDLEDATDEELDYLQKQFEQLRQNNGKQ
jgi:low affinity Fe/Cu permease